MESRNTLEEDLALIVVEHDIKSHTERERERRRNNTDCYIMCMYHKCSNLIPTASLKLTE